MYQFQFKRIAARRNIILPITAGLGLFLSACQSQTLQHGMYGPNAKQKFAMSGSAGVWQKEASIVSSIEQQAASAATPAPAQPHPASMPEYPAQGQPIPTGHQAPQTGLVTIDGVTLVPPPRPGQLDELQMMPEGEYVPEGESVPDFAGNPAQNNGGAYISDNAVVPYARNKDILTPLSSDPSAPLALDYPGHNAPTHDHTAGIQKPIAQQGYTAPQQTGPGIGDPKYNYLNYKPK